VSSQDSEGSTGGGVTTGRASLAGQVKDEESGSTLVLQVKGLGDQLALHHL